MRTNDEIMNILDSRKEELDLSISEIGRQMGIAKSAISRYFNRQRELPLNKIDQFAEVFKLDVEYLLGFTEEVEKCEELNEKYHRLDDDQKKKVHDFIDELLLNK